MGMNVVGLYLIEKIDIFVFMNALFKLFTDIVNLIDKPVLKLLNS